MNKTLSLSDYSPNFNDPRIRKRAAAVLAWCDQLRLNRKGRPIHHDKLVKVFGNYRQPGFAQWLYVNLLAQSGKYQPGVSSFTYRLKEAGYRKVHEKLGTDPPNELEVVKAVYGPILSGDASPEYNDKGDRRYHPIQNIQRDLRKQAFAGWWDYDIEACAPTLIYQFASRKHQAMFGAGADPFPTVSRLINEKQAVRAHLVELLGIDVQQAKELLAALLFRATLAPSAKARVFSSLGSDEVRFHRLVNDEFIVRLRSEVERMWRFARLQQLLEARECGIPTSRSKKAGQIRMKLYLSLERRVMDAMFRKLTEKAVPVVLVHDGFMAKAKVDTVELEGEVFSSTGFTIRLIEVDLSKAVEVEDEIDVLQFAKDETDDELDEIEDLPIY